MKAILLATGEKAKLMPLTAAIPSPLLPVANRPVIVHGIELLVRSGLKDILICLQHRAAAIETTLGSGERWDTHFQYLLQRKDWGSAGVLKRVERMFSDTIFVMPADRILDVDIAAALEYHYDHAATVTAILAHPSRPHPDSKREIDEVISRVRLFDELAGASATPQSTGAYLLEPAALLHIPENEVFDCHLDLLPALEAAGEKVIDYVTPGYWNPLNTFAEYIAAQQIYLSSIGYPADAAPAPNRIRRAYVPGRQLAEDVWMDPGSSVHASAQITPPVYIGAGCRIGRNVELGPAVVIGANSIVDDDASISHSLIVDHTYIGKLMSIDDRIVRGSLLINAVSGTSVQMDDPIFLHHVDEGLMMRILRALVDRALAFFLLVLLSPLFAVISLAIGVTSSGPVFTRVIRNGARPSCQQNGPTRLEQVALLRWRTRAADGSPVPFGLLLEGWELMRLPELINVLRGNLALVGVKPLTMEEIRRVDEAWQRRREQYPAGFTGLWYTSLGADATLDDICIADVYQGSVHGWSDDWVLFWRTPAAWRRRMRMRRLEEAAAFSVATPKSQILDVNLQE